MRACAIVYDDNNREVAEIAMFADPKYDYTVTLLPKWDADHGTEDFIYQVICNFCGIKSFVFSEAVRKGAISDCSINIINSGGASK